MLSTGLAKRGIDVIVATPRRRGQQAIEHLDGVTVLAVSPVSLRKQMMIYRTCGADIFHSQEPSLATWLAMKAAPSSKHVVTCQNPRVFNDWLIQLRSYLGKKSPKLVLSVLYENNPLVSRATKNADRVFCQARYTIPIAEQKYKLKHRPGFLANPVNIPVGESRKSDHPTVCFVGRWDKIKRPELFFELAREFPDVSFIAMGKAHDLSRDTYLRRAYESIPNLEMIGFIDQFSSARFQEVLSKSWVLINTSLRECLPMTFLEAASFKCALLCAANPDDFATEFGYWARAGDFAEGLHFLLNNDEWMSRGEKGYDYVKKTAALDSVVAKHVDVYSELLGEPAPGPKVEPHSQNPSRPKASSAAAPVP